MRLRSCRTEAKNYMKHEVFESRSVWKAIFTMTIPALITILVMIFYNMADMLFIGQLGNTSLIAGVSLISPVFSILMALATMIGAGGSIIIASSFGEKNTDRAKGCASVCFWTNVLLGTLMIILLNLFSSPLLEFLGARADTWEPALQYMRALSIGAPFMMVCTASGTMVRAEGAVKEGLIGNMTGTVINLILDPLFILVFRWGVSGAAAATVIGNIAGTVYYLHYILARSSVMSVSVSKAGQYAGILREVIPLGVPNAVSTVLSGLASTFSHQILAGYGTDYLAAAAAAGRINMLVTMLQMGIAMGVQPLLSYSFGARDFERMNEVLKKTMLLTTSVGVVMTAICMTLRLPLIRLFLKTPEAADIGARYVVWLMLGAVTLGLYYVSSNFLQATKHAGAAIIVSALRQGALLIPMLYIMHGLFGFWGIAYAHAAADITAALTALSVFLYFYRKTAAETRH